MKVWTSLIVFFVSLISVIPVFGAGKSEGESRVCIEALVQVVKVQGFTHRLQAARLGTNHGAAMSSLVDFLMSEPGQAFVSRLNAPRRVQREYQELLVNLSRLVHSFISDGSQTGSSIFLNAVSSRIRLSTDLREQAGAFEALADLYLVYSPADSAWDGAFGGGIVLSESQRLELAGGLYKVAKFLLTDRPDLRDDFDRVSAKISRTVQRPRVQGGSSK